ncbi:MAG: hypothetical protein ACREP9_19075 [Candidatus Dormibacteraceae bacterium]
MANYQTPSGATWRRRIVVLIGVAAVVCSALATMTGPAEAAVFTCNLGLNPTDHCTTVTGINPGSSLALHHAPNYTSGTIPNFSGQNGKDLIAHCWAKGAGDADGHGDQYWFYVDDGSHFAGWVNDWYLTTGGYAQWSPVIHSCPNPNVLKGSPE